MSFSGSTITSPNGLTREQVERALSAPYVSGRWYPTTEGVVAPAAVAAVDTLYLYPVQIKRRVAITGLTIRVTAFAAGSAKLAWWRQSETTGDATGLAVIGSDSAISVDTSNGYKDILGLSATLDAGVYFVGSVYTGALASLMANSNAAAAFSMLMGNTAATRPYGTSGTTQRTGISIAQPFANNIMALDLTGGGFTELAGTQVPAQAWRVA